MQQGGSVIAQDQFPGVPDYYVLAVTNVNFFLQSSATTVPAAGQYQLTFSPRWPAGNAQTIDLAASGNPTITPSSTADLPRVSPLGDVNSDGRADFVAAGQNIVSANFAGAAAAPVPGDAYAWITLGSSSPQSFTFTSASPVLHYYRRTGETAPMLSLGPGDFNGDRIGDVAVAVSNVPDPRVYILLGKSSGWAGDISLDAEADVVLSSSVADPLKAGGSLTVASAGDVNADGADDLLIGDPAHGASSQGAAFLFYGSKDWAQARQLLAADFSSPSGFVLSPASSPVAWHLTQRRNAPSSGPGSLYFGREDTATYDDPGTRVSGTATTPAISLAGLPADAPVHLALSSFLATENAAGYDQAIISLSTDGQSFTPIAANAGAVPLGRGRSQWRLPR